MTRQFVKAGYVLDRPHYSCIVFNSNSAFVTIGDLSSENASKIVSELGE